MMTKKSFVATEKALGRSWRESLKESMNEAAEEEKWNAIERGSFHVVNMYMYTHTCMHTHGLCTHSYIIFK